MTELKDVNADIKQRFNDNIIQENMNIFSGMIEHDMLRYDRTLDAEEETDEY